MSNPPAFFHLTNPDTPEDIWLMIRVVTNSDRLHDFSYSLKDLHVDDYLWDGDRPGTEYAWRDVEDGVSEYPISIVPRSFV